MKENVEIEKSVAKKIHKSLIKNKPWRVALNSNFCNAMIYMQYIEHFLIDFILFSFEDMQKKYALVILFPSGVLDNNRQYKN